MPFDIPDNWTWVKFGNLVNIQTGASFSKGDSIQKNKEGYIRVLRGGNITPFKYLFKPDDLFIPTRLINDSIRLQEFDLITPAVTSLENIGKVAVIDKGIGNTTAGGFVYIFRPFITNIYISLIIMNFMSSSLFQKLMKEITKKSGQAFYNMNKEKLKGIYFPIPPLEEQQRIVDKINSFEPLLQDYEGYEKKLTELESTFPDRLKKSILQYAIEGKLVKQDPNDEPASVLLERIKEAKESLIKAGKIKRDKNESCIYQGDDKNYYENLPAGWTLSRLSNFGVYKKGPFGSSLTKGMFVDKNTPNCIKVYEQKNAIHHNAFIGNYYISYQKYQELKSFEVMPNDIIVSCAGTIGEIYQLPTNAPKGIINQALMKISLFDNDIADYFQIVLSDALSRLSEKSKGTAIKNIVPFEVLKPAVVLIPPLVEQRKIINKLESINRLIYS